MLDPQLRDLLAFAKASGAPGLADLPVPACRAFYRELLAATDLREAADVQVDLRQIDGPGGPLPLQVYTPQQAPAGPRGLVVYLHGGGFALGDVACYDRVLRHWCEQADVVIVAVDYRLAPEHPFPAAVDDARATLAWAVAQAAALGADPARTAVVGDSAGGNLAAGLALWARDEGLPLRYQVLLYPVLAERPGGFASYERYATGYVLTRRDTEHFWQLYAGAAGAAWDWRGAPLTAPSVAGVAPALVLVGGYDVLRDEAVAYAGRLCEADVQATLVEYAGLSHGFINMAGALSAARLALEQVGAALRIALKS